MIDVYAPAGTFRGRAVKERIWVLLTEAPDRAARAQFGKNYNAPAS
jgi:hypothetical protein